MMSEGSADLTTSNKTYQDKIAISQERIQTGRLLYRYAWTIEIFAVAIGFGIAVMQLITSFNELNTGKGGNLDFGDYTNMVIAAVPFVMLAVVELTKIPLVDAFYKTSHRAWKVVFIVSLMLISGITFESALNGFERNFNAMNISVTRLTKELLVTEESMVPIRERVDRAAALNIETIESEYTERYNELSNQRTSQVEQVEGRVRTLRASVQSEYTAGLQNQLSAARAQTSDLRVDLRAALDEASQRFTTDLKNLQDTQNSTIRSLAGDYQREQDRLDEVRNNGAKEIADASFLTANDVRRRVETETTEQREQVQQARTWLEKARSGAQERGLSERFAQEQKRIQGEFDSRRSLLQQEIRELTAEYNKSIGTRERDVEGTLNGYDREIQSIEKKYAEQFAEIKDRREEDLNTLKNNAILIAGWESDLDELRDNRVSLRDKVNTAVGDNQIYRLAALASGAESAADVPKNYVANVAVIWFGSLAAMVAFTGVILAIASNVIRDPAIPETNKAQKGRLRLELIKAARSSRRWLAHRRRLDRKPIIRERIREVVKEIPVDRIVKHEVPVEIFKKELVHVPLYTNDPGLLKTGHNANGKFDAGETEANSHRSQPEAAPTNGE